LNRGRENRSSPSLRTGLADIPHPTLQLVVHLFVRIDRRRRELHTERAAHDPQRSHRSVDGHAPHSEARVRGLRQASSNAWPRSRTAICTTCGAVRATVKRCCTTEDAACQVPRPRRLRGADFASVCMDCARPPPQPTANHCPNNPRPPRL
jgi:hypothetical protein